MNLTKTSGRRTTALLASLLAGVSLLGAADDVNTAPVSGATGAAAAQSTSDEIARLRAALAAQQKQLETLQHSIEQQQKLLEKSMDAAASASQTATRKLGTVASLTPVLPAPASAMPAIPAVPAAQKSGARESSNPCEAGPDENAVPPYLRLGSVCIVPVGFMDATMVWRDKNAASGIGTNFGSVPFNNAVNGNLSEFRFSPQNSRLGVRLDGDWKGAHFIGYNEFDFLGTSGGTNLTVTNGAFVPRLRLFWVDVRKGKLEFLAGQSWSMLTPNRKGISPLPGDIFYSQVIDVNYMAGLTWTRQPGVRFLYHPSEKLTFGLSLENPDQYIGGSAGGSGITLPSGFTGLAGSQLDNGPNIGTANTVLAAPTVAPDVIAKVAFDPSSRLHVEVAGLERTFKTVNPASLSQHYTATGGGLQFGINAEVVKNIRLISTNFWSDGGGRYLFGQAPDLIVRGDGRLSLIHSGGTVDGVEATIKNTMLYAYYGGIYVQRNAAYDSTGKTLAGYGYTGAPNNQNRAINELTFGFNQTMWKNPRYGALNFMGQYEWMQRNPWYVALGAPKATHDNTIYINLRYTLPGSMPNF
ncbi:MAG TPA: hypothetical protein VHB50_02385 [Bryobacteraceae bacterium]|nr:hypothetical protein [Bryobacteraceae bacterium]